MRNRRAVTPATGVSLLVAIVVLLAVVVGSMAFGFDFDDGPSHAAISATAHHTANGQTRVRLLHEAGDSLDSEALSVRVRVAGTPLSDQPPVPFFSATGFASGPSGPFNSKSADKTWSVGESAAFVIAGTNDPDPRTGDRLVLRFVVGDHVVATARTTVE